MLARERQGMLVGERRVLLVGERWVLFVGEHRCLLARERWVVLARERRVLPAGEGAGDNRYDHVCLSEYVQLALDVVVQHLQDVACLLVQHTIEQPGICRHCPGGVRHLAQVRAQGGSGPLDLISLKRLMLQVNRGPSLLGNVGPFAQRRDVVLQRNLSVPAGPMRGLHDLAAETLGLPPAV